MMDTRLNEREALPDASVLLSAQRFAEAFSASVEFQEFEGAYLEFHADDEAQSTLQAYQGKVETLRALMELKAVPEEDGRELENLRQKFYQRRAVTRFFETQQNLIRLSQGLGDRLSEVIGLDYASSCVSGSCCGTSSEATGEKAVLNDALRETSESLGAALAQSPAFRQYRSAEEKLREDENARCLLAAFSELQRTLRSPQGAVSLSEEDFMRARALQSEIGQDEIIQTFNAAKDQAVAELRQINQEINRLLGIDFASFAIRSGGCC